jgi:hypothetical protein
MARLVAVVIMIIMAAMVVMADGLFVRGFTAAQGSAAAAGGEEQGEERKSGRAPFGLGGLSQHLSDLRPGPPDPPP